MNSPGPVKTALIAGAGIAGTSLAYWLLRSGIEPVIVERAPKFRGGGYIMDIWGVGYDVAERMGLVPALRELGYRNDRALFVDRNGAARSEFGARALHRFLGDRYLSVQRSDLARAIYDRIHGAVDVLLDDEVLQIDQMPESVIVVLRSGTVRRFDYVFGCDGLHSALRAMVQPPHRFEHHLGYYAAAFETAGYTRRDEHTYLTYGTPGALISRFALRGDRTGFLFVFRRHKGMPLCPTMLDEQKAILLRRFAIDPWIEWTEIQEHLTHCHDLYFDSVSQIEMPTWSNRRVAFVGDAAYAPSLLAGEGAALAMTGAFVLAGELARAQGAHKQAFTSYEKVLRTFVARRQRNARHFAASLTPGSRIGLLFRDLILRLGTIPSFGDVLMRRYLTDSFAPPGYSAR